MGGYITRKIEILSDGSTVYNVLVHLDRCDAALEFHCVSERDATEFEDKIYHAIQDHTVDSVLR